MVADALSRIPWSEKLSSLLLCSCTCTLGLEHIDDGCADVDSADLALHGIVSIFENSSFL